MNMTNQKFIAVFFSTLLSLVVLYLVFICVVNPQQTAPVKLSSKYDTFHDNFVLRKVQKMEGQDYETLIIGSSTSETFTVQEVNHYFKTTSFHASIGGGNTILRYVLFKKALKNFSKLKRVLYIADFYEFNQTATPPMLSFNKDLSSEIENPKLVLGTGAYLKYLFSHQLIESAFTVLKRRKKGYESPLLKDGSTTTSMIMSKVHTEENFNSKIRPENVTKLRDEILENNGTYSRSVLANFKELNPEVKGLYLDMIKKAQERNIEIVFVMSPYHAEFRKLLFQNADIKNRYSDWVEFFNSLKANSNVSVYNALESRIAIDPESGVWRDGIHYDNSASAYFLGELTELKK